MANQNNNSDYTKSRINLFDLLPEVNQSDTNKAVIENLLNRFLSKQEIQTTVGYIGKGNPNAIVKRQLTEPTVHRQAFQLQPILSNKIGSVEHMASWKDIENELERLGVNIDDIADWGSLLQFNWAPPVDIDKLIHYDDYYWFDENNPNSTPQYITIRSRCATAFANVNFWEALIAEFGETIDIAGIGTVDGYSSLPTFSIKSLTSATDTVVVEGNATEELSIGDYFTISGSVNNSGTFEVNSTPTFDANTFSTSFTVVAGTITTTELNVGTIYLKRYDKLIVQGDYTRLFDPGFIFIVRESTNTALNGTFLEVTEATFNSSLDQTTITVDATFSDNTSSGVISLQEQLDLSIAERDCRCTGSVGWDLLQWDDNPNDPLWGGTTPGEHATLIASISNAGAPSAAGTQGELWYDTTSDILYQYDSVTDWTQIWNKFSLVLEKTKGYALWDYTAGCETSTIVKTAEQWVENNKWLHKSDVPNFSIAKKAQLPIIEYDWDVELNEWTYTDYRWKYRSEKNSEWVEVDVNPSTVELVPLDWWELDGGTDEIVFDDRFGDLTDHFVPGSHLGGVGINGIYTVDYSTYSSVSDQPFKTRIKLTEAVSGTDLLPGSLVGGTPSKTPIRPYTTSFGHPWKDYGEHWLFIGSQVTLPVNHQTENPQTIIPLTEVAVEDISGLFDYKTWYSAEEFTVTGTPFAVFELSQEVKAGTTRSLRRRSLLGFDDIRVYINDQRQYGTYDELEEDVVSIIGFTSTALGDAADTWKVAEPVDGVISNGDIIRVEGNTGASVSGEYTVSSVSGDTITVSTVIPASATITGGIANVTTPMEGLSTAVSYVRGIQFLTGLEPNIFDRVRIVVGESALHEVGDYYIPVRVDENDLDYAANGNTITSLVQYRKVEQIKTHLNQYPIFDVYNVDGTSAHQANAIFGYRTSSEEDVTAEVGMRIVFDSTTRSYEFDQFLLSEDNGKLYAYRDYSNDTTRYWYNPETKELKFWTGLNWDTKTDTSGHYISAYVGDMEPSDFYKNIDGMFWFDTLNNKLFQRSVSAGEWIEEVDVDITTSDNTLQTIWKKGLNDEMYIPDMVDWEGRSQEEYNVEKTLFVEDRTRELLLYGDETVESAAAIRATNEWYEKQKNVHSSTGEWVGDWEVPDPMFFNTLNENRKYLSTQELLTHFNSIIQAQPKIPGYFGPKESMFHLIATDNVNYGLGGKIKQYNDSFDTMLSSIFVNNVTPITLFEFAHDQYETLLNSLTEIFRKSSVEYLTDTSLDYLVNLSSAITEDTISTYEQNDNNAFVYGDTTTFTEVDGANDLGVRNWIATLPYLKLVRAVTPGRRIDASIGLNQVIHHDGHRHDYEISQADTESIIQTVIRQPDSRTSFPGPSDPPLDTFGKASQTSLPPDTIAEFDSVFNTTILNREGVYWYYTPTAESRTLYRLAVAGIGIEEPASSLEDGSLWIDLTPGSEVLRVKETNAITGIADWPVVSGLALGDGRLHNGIDPSDLTTATISAWAEVDLNSILGDIVLEIENRLYENAPSPTELRYDFDALSQTYPTQYNQYLYEAFLDYASQREITAPLSNSEYSASDPWTWNYNFSAPSSGLQIVEADSSTNSFVLYGDQVASFDPCSDAGSCPSTFTFLIKNSGVNDGTWTTIVSDVGDPAAIYDAVNDLTRIYVDGAVTDSVDGVIYSGQLPSSTNDGSEAGANWRSYYEELYGTPYPHIEPWVLQGYDEKPLWWDEEYANDDFTQWGSRTWKYKHGFDIIGVDTTNDYFNIAGNFVDAFLPAAVIQVDHSDGVHDGTYTVASLDTVVTATTGTAGNATIEISGDVLAKYPAGASLALITPTNTLKGTYTVRSRVYNGAPDDKTVITVEEAISDASNIATVGCVYYPSTEKTVIGVVDDITSSAIEGRIKVAYGMWENIRIGVIPAGRDYPNGITSITGNPSIDNASIPAPALPSYNYFSVNIDNTWVSADGGNTKYYPDEIFPPYWDYVAFYGSGVAVFDRVVRSVFYDYNVEIVAPGSDFAFGDGGPNEWEWRHASQFLYDQLTVAFRLDPIGFTADSFGVDFITVGGLNIDSRTERVMSHNRTDFHGEIIGNTPLFVAGTNQWYVNYNRYTGFDTSFSDFRSQWTQWIAPLTYQFSSFIDTPSLNVDHRYVDMSEFDYSVVSKKSPGFEDFWLDAFNVTVLSIPPRIARYDNQLDWRFEINTNLPVSRSIEYYDVRNYQFYANPTTDTCTLYTWPVSGVDIYNQSFSVVGDQTYVFTSGREFTVTESGGNDGTYTASSAVYNVVTNETIIEVDETVPSLVSGGIITANYRNLPWATGDSVYLSSVETLPVPLEGQTSIGLIKYFIIIESDNTFKLARTYQNALDGVSIDITSTGRRDYYVGELAGTFRADASDTIWRHYAIDTAHVLTLNTPHDVQGMQTLINIVDGYDRKLQNDGWKINEDHGLQDPDSGQLINWQVEVERFITFAYNLQTIRYQVADRHEVSVDATTDIWTFDDQNRLFITGDAVNIFSSNGVYPAPFIRGVKYYVIRDSLTTFRLAASKRDAMTGTAINVLSSAGTGQLYVNAASDSIQQAPSQEINPMRNAVWFHPTRGIVSNVIAGPAEDVRTTQLIFDQYGRPLQIDNLRIFREDKRTTIRVVEGIENDVDRLILENPYNEIHLGGVHLFIDSYEHALKFNNYTSDGVLLYDPFIGLNVTKFEMLFNRGQEFTGRPNVGGYYLDSNIGEGTSLRRNIEAGVEDIRTLYDTHTVLETNPLMVQSRKVLGYEGTRDYLDNMNLNPKSQFLFWKGLIQYKGSKNAMNAYINSRRIIDAKLDEYWAIKVADFGSAREKVYPEMYVTTVDARSNDLRLQFVESDAETVDGTFTSVALSDDARWYNQPDQIATLKAFGPNLHFDLGISNTVSITTEDYSTAPEVGTEHGQGVIVNGTWNGIAWNIDPTYVYFYRWNAYTSTWDNHGSWTGGSNPVLRHGFMSDAIIMTTKLYSDGFYEEITGVTGTTLTVTSGYIPLAGGIRVFKNGKQLTESSDYYEIPSVGNLTSTSIGFVDALIPSDVIQVKHVVSTLIENVHYEYVNVDIVRILEPDLVNILQYTGDLTMWGVALDKEAQNPARLLDKEAEAVLANIQVWDPARGIHYSNAIHNIDTYDYMDPARYSYSVQTLPLAEAGHPRPVPWGSKQVGTTWLAAANLGYVPYFDEFAIPDTEDRLRLWGQLADWSSVDVYEWVQSDVPPSEYDALSAVEEGDISIEESVRKTGSARLNLFKKVGAEWVPYEMVYEGHDPAITGIVNGSSYDFLVSGTFADTEVVDVYVNGSLRHEGIVVGAITPGYITVDCVEADHIEVIQMPPTDQAVIDAGIAAGTMLQDYEYSTETSIDTLGNRVTTYFFWVKNKSTRAQGKNRTLPCNEVERTLVTIPSPYVIYQNALVPTTVLTEGDKTVARAELQLTTASQTAFEVELPIAVNTNVSITIDSVPLPSTEITFVAGTRIITVTTPLTGDQTAEIQYTGTYDSVVDLPPRFNQAVIRGLRGWVSADRRYTIRFTRDFTLRDSLEHGKTPLDLHNAHEEWEMFRQHQPYHVKRELWDKVTESIVGYKLTDSSVRVPSYERNLYDEKYDTDTRYGLGDGQAFTNGDLALATIIADLENPEQDFKPIDINVFFSDYSFDTNENIIEAMDAIYNTFAFEHVNRMMFSVLHDAMSLKSKYPDIIKTSMVSLHGIRPFQSAGVFDD